METKDKTKCEPCEQAFGENVEKMVDTVEHHTTGEHDKRQHEVNSAFGREGEKAQQENCREKSCEAGREWHTGSRSEHGADAGCASKENRPSHKAYDTNGNHMSAAEHGTEHGTPGETGAENRSGYKPETPRDTNGHTEYGRHERETGRHPEQQHGQNADQQHSTTSHYPGKNEKVRNY